MSTAKWGNLVLQPQQPAHVTFESFVWQPKDCLSNLKVASLSQRRMENVHFPCIFGRCLDASRKLQGSLVSDIHTIDAQFHTKYGWSFCKSIFVARQWQNTSKHTTTADFHTASAHLPCSSHDTSLLYLNQFH